MAGKLKDNVNGDIALFQAANLRTKGRPISPPSLARLEHRLIMEHSEAQRGEMLLDALSMPFTVIAPKIGEILGKGDSLRNEESAEMNEISGNIGRILAGGTLELASLAPLGIGGIKALRNMSRFSKTSGAFKTALTVEEMAVINKGGLVDELLGKVGASMEDGVLGNRYLDHTVSAKLPTGSVSYGKKPPRFFSNNAPEVINGREYSGHVLDQMRKRGVLPSLVENTIKTGEAFPGKDIFTSRYYDVVNNLSVVVNKETGRVVTTYWGKI
jgi:hypothetical protein